MTLQHLFILGCLVATSNAYSFSLKKQTSGIHGIPEEHKTQVSKFTDEQKIGKYFDLHPAAEVANKNERHTQEKLNKVPENGYHAHEMEENASSIKNLKKDAENRENKESPGEENGERKLASDRIYGTGWNPGYTSQPPYWRNEYDGGIDRNIFFGPEYGRPYIYPSSGIPDVYNRDLVYNGLNRDGYSIYNGGIYNRDGYGVGYNGYNGLNRDGYGLVNSLYPGTERGYYLGSDGLANNRYGYRLPLSNGIIPRNPGIYGVVPSRETGYGLFPDDRIDLYGSRSFNNRVNYSDPISTYLYGRGSSSNGRDLYGYNPSYARGLYEDIGGEPRSKIKSVDSKLDNSPSEEVKSEVNPFLLGME